MNQKYAVVIQKWIRGFLIRKKYFHANRKRTLATQGFGIEENYFFGKSKTNFEAFSVKTEKKKKKVLVIGKKEFSVYNKPLIGLFFSQRLVESKAFQKPCLDLMVVKSVKKEENETNVGSNDLSHNSSSFASLQKIPSEKNNKITLSKTVSQKAIKFLSSKSYVCETKIICMLCLIIKDQTETNSEVPKPKIVHKKFSSSNNIIKPDQTPRKRKESKQNNKEEIDKARGEILRIFKNEMEVTPKKIKTSREHLKNPLEKTPNSEKMTVADRYKMYLSNFPPKISKIDKKRSPYDAKNIEKQLMNFYNLKIFYEKNHGPVPKLRFVSTKKNTNTFKNSSNRFGSSTPEI